MRSPALPAGSVTSSSLLAWITSAVPPSWKTEFGLPFSKVMSLLTTVSVRLPFAGVVIFDIEPAWAPGRGLRERDRADILAVLHPEICGGRRRRGRSGRLRRGDCQGHCA